MAGEAEWAEAFQAVGAVAAIPVVVAADIRVAGAVAEGIQVAEEAAGHPRANCPPLGQCSAHSARAAAARPSSASSEDDSKDSSKPTEDINQKYYVVSVLGLSMPSRKNNSDSSDNDRQSADDLRSRFLDAGTLIPTQQDRHLGRGRPVRGPQRVHGDPVSFSEDVPALSG